MRYLSCLSFGSPKEEEPPIPVMNSILRQVAWRVVSAWERTLIATLAVCFVCCVIGGALSIKRFRHPSQPQKTHSTHIKKDNPRTDDVSQGPVSSGKNQDLAKNATSKNTGPETVHEGLSDPSLPLRDMSRGEIQRILDSYKLRVQSMTCDLKEEANQIDDLKKELGALRHEHEQQRKLSDQRTVECEKATAFAREQVKEKEARIKELEDRLFYVADTGRLPAHDDKILSETTKKLSLVLAEADKYKAEASELTALLRSAKTVNKSKEKELAQTKAENERQQKKNKELGARLDKAKFDNNMVYEDNKRMRDNSEKVHTENNELKGEKRELHEKIRWLAQRLVSLHPEMELEVAVKLDDGMPQSDDSRGEEATPVVGEAKGQETPGDDSKSEKYVSYF
jgi:hypothetical protein